MGRTASRRAIAPLGWTAAVLLLSHSGSVVSAVPFLGVFRGRLGAVLGAVAVGVSISHTALGAAMARAIHRAVTSVRWRPAVVWVCSALGLALLGIHYAARMRVSGDEPHYLLMTQSLLREHDLDLADNYARGDYREYLPALPATHYGAPRRDGRPFPAHSPGLPALLAPAYAMGGRMGCVILLAGLAAVLAIETRKLASQAVGGTATHWAWLVAVLPPVAFYAFHIYTEIPSALCMVVGLRILTSIPGPRGAVRAAIFASALPWLHVKMVPAAAALGVIGLCRLRGRALAGFVTVCVLVAAAYSGFFLAIFGQPTPLALYGGVPGNVVWTRMPQAALGVLLDRSFGLLPMAPIFLLALAGLPACLARGRFHDVAPPLLVGIAILLPVVSWRMWWGGQCPPGRLLVPIVPLLALPIVARLNATRPSGLARWRVALLGLTVGLAVFMTIRPEEMLLLNRRDRPTRVWDALSEPNGVQVGRYLPSLVSAEPSELRVTVIWCAAFAFLLVLDHLASRRETIDRWFSGLGLPLGMVLAIGLLTDHWARAGLYSVVSIVERAR